MWVTYQVRLLKPKIGGEYIDSGFAILERNNFTEQSGGQIFQFPEQYVRSSSSNLDVTIPSDDTISIGRMINERSYLINIMTFTPSGDPVSGEAAGYFLY